MSQIVYAALFVVFIGACALGLLLAVLAQVLSGRRRRPRRRKLRPGMPAGVVIPSQGPAAEPAHEAPAHRAKTTT
jgi:hypothetical protein